MEGFFSREANARLGEAPKLNTQTEQDNYEKLREKKLIEIERDAVKAANSASGSIDMQELGHLILLKGAFSMLGWSHMTELQANLDAAKLNKIRSKAEEVYQDHLRYGERWAETDRVKTELFETASAVDSPLKDVAKKERLMASVKRVHQRLSNLAKFYARNKDRLRLDYGGQISRRNIFTSAQNALVFGYFRDGFSDRDQITKGKLTDAENLKRATLLKHVNSFWKLPQ
jgi:hypothetical protein